MKSEKKLVIFCACILLGSACFLVYSYSGWMEENKDVSFPGNKRNIIKENQLLAKGIPADKFRKQNVTLKTQIVSIDGSAIQVVSVGTVSKFPILLLHGAMYSSKTWINLGTMHGLGNLNFYAVAIDLPGFGSSEKLKSDIPKDVFIDKLITALNLERPIIISPSMSGMYSVPYIVKHGLKVSGYIPVSPVIENSYTADDFKKINVPTLIIYGEKDVGAIPKNKLLSNISGSKVQMISNGQHACYQDDPQLFLKLVSDFVNSLK